jgi:hypothetical protein
MEYNTQRKKLVISEYGRNLQQMIDHILTVPDRDKRTQYAYAIVDIMAQMHNQKESQEFRVKLWDHLYIMADFKLDVDSPFKMPDPESLAKKPDMISYPKGGIRFHHYGRNIQLIIEKVIDIEDGPEKEAVVKLIANHLKKSYLNWNRESVDDDLITKHLDELSNGKLELAENDQLNTTSDILALNKRKAKSNQRPQSNQRSQGGSRNQNNPRQNHTGRRRTK